MTMPNTNTLPTTAVVPNSKTVLSIPIISWMMPVVAVAFMVHVVEGLREREAGS